MNYPKLSIITATKNAADGLLRTINSIQNLNYPKDKLEYIVIDGASKDGTLELLQDKSNSNINIKFISEPDSGISDAFNKGLRLATGDYINFQGAGDSFYSQDCLTKLFDGFNPTYKLICGQICRVSEDYTKYLWVAPKKIRKFNKYTLLLKMGLPHQGLFTHKDFFIKFGEFDLNCKYAMDYEILLRAFADFPKTILKPIIVANWAAGGVGAGNLAKVIAEYHAIKVKHQIAPKFILNTINYILQKKYTKYS